MSDNALVLQNSLDISSNIGSYMDRINSLPLLSVEEERDLALRFKKNNDLDAAQKLIVGHLRFVLRVAKKYTGYGLALADLVQEGTVGLMKAVRRFDPERMVRLATFAVHWIKSEIHEYIISNWKIVKVATTKAQRKLFFNLRKKRKNLDWMEEQERISLAKDLNVPVKEVYKMEERLTNHDVVSFQPVDIDENSNLAYKAEAAALHGPNDNVENLVAEDDFKRKFSLKLNQFLEKLDFRARKIISSRYLSNEKSTLDELAKEFSLSKERIRQIEKKTINILKEEFSCLT